MSPLEHAPRPVRPLKRHLENLDPDRPASKRHRQSLLPLPTPPIDDQHPKDIHPNGRPSSALSSPKATSTRKRDLGDRDSDCAPASKRPRLQSPAFSPAPSLRDWLSQVPRTESVPPTIGGSETNAAIAKNIDRPKSLPVLHFMSQQPHGNNGRGSAASGQTSKPGTSAPLYRSVLFNNNVVMDFRGKRLPEDLQKFRDTDILKQRSSLQLGDDTVLEVMDTAEEIAESTEAPTSKLIRTAMFPLKYGRGVGEGGNTLWSTDPLPSNPLYQYSLAAPKPDVHLGYSTGQRSQWSFEESNVIDHRVAQPYIQPARDNTLPFLMFEIKSEAAGGTLWHAENQAAGSGSHSVSALGWLLEQASTTTSTKDTVAFTATVTHREVIFYIHWQSPEDRRFYMSYLKCYSSLEAEEIRGCNNTVKNITDHALGPRKTTIKTALQALFPFPDNWKVTRPADSLSSTSPTSLVSESTRAGKRQRRS